MDGFLPKPVDGPRVVAGALACKVQDCVDYGEVEVTMSAPDLGEFMFWVCKPHAALFTPRFREGDLSLSPTTEAESIALVEDWRRREQWQGAIHNPSVHRLVSEAIAYGRTTSVWPRSVIERAKASIEEDSRFDVPKPPWNSEEWEAQMRADGRADEV